MTMELEGCELSKNGSSGLRLAWPDNESDNSKDMTRLILKDCSITDNDGSGIVHNDKLCSIISIMNSTIEGNSEDGVRLEPSTGSSADVRLSNTSVSRNVDCGIYALRPVKMKLEGCFLLEM